MSQDIEATIAELRELLPYVARDAERFRNPTELVSRSLELRLAARAIDETLPWPSLASTARGPFIQVRIGSKAVEALTMRKLPYDFIEAETTMAEPGEEYTLLYKHDIRTDTLGSNNFEPVYGQMKYFNLATLGRTLEDGGELSPIVRE